MAALTIPTSLSIALWMLTGIAPADLAKYFLA